jgi:hypothetical protein
VLFSVRTKGKSKTERIFILIDRSELDRKDAEKTKVQVKVILQNPQTYRKHSESFKNASKKANGSMSVKMV